MIHTGLAASGAALSARRVIGANDRVRVGLIGCGGRGRTVAKLMAEGQNVEFSAVCDVYARNADAAREWAGSHCASFADFRKLLDHPNLDAVLIATPDHWHAIPTLLACQAGKDVYVEKPLAHNIAEGRAMVQAARRYQRIVQAGTQQRSAPHYQQMARLVQNGSLGAVHYVRIWNFANLSPHGIGRAADSEVPPGLDWDFYLGPAPWRPFNRSRFLNTFRWFWDYAGGTITDFGTHRFDSMQQAMAVQAPLTVSASGHRYALDDGGETPDVLQVTYEYPNFVLSYEACALNAHGLGGRTPGRSYYQARGLADRPHGEAFYGTAATLFSDRLGYEIYPELKPSSPAPGAGGPGGEPRRPVDAALAMTGLDATAEHAKNFIDCVRTRRRPAADVEIGHQSTIVAHLGNIAYRTGRKLHWDSAREEFKGDLEANAFLRREPRKPWDLIR